jgi:hypothetical protein
MIEKSLRFKERYFQEAHRVMFAHEPPSLKKFFEECFEFELFVKDHTTNSPHRGCFKGVRSFPSDSKDRTNISRSKDVVTVNVPGRQASSSNSIGSSNQIAARNQYVSPLFNTLKITAHPPSRTSMSSNPQSSGSQKGSESIGGRIIHTGTISPTTLPNSPVAYKELEGSFEVRPSTNLAAPATSDQPSRTDEQSTVGPRSIKYSPFDSYASLLRSRIDDGSFPKTNPHRPIKCLPHLGLSPRSDSQATSHGSSPSSPLIEVGTPLSQEAQNNHWSPFEGGNTPLDGTPNLLEIQDSLVLERGQTPNLSPMLENTGTSFEKQLDTAIPPIPSANPLKETENENNSSTLVDKPLDSEYLYSLIFGDELQDLVLQVAEMVSRGEIDLSSPLPDLVGQKAERDFFDFSSPPSPHELDGRNILDRLASEMVDRALIDVSSPPSPPPDLDGRNILDRLASEMVDRALIDVSSSQIDFDEQAAPSEKKVIDITTIATVSEDDGHGHA